jgi:hypothetical protein
MITMSQRNASSGMAWHVRQPPAQKDMALLHLPISQGLESSSWCLVPRWRVVAVYNFDSQSIRVKIVISRSDRETPRLFPRAVACDSPTSISFRCSPPSLSVLVVAMLPILGDANMHEESGKSGHLPEPACMHVFLPIHPSTHDHHDVAFVDSLFDPAFRSNARTATTK